MNLTRLLILGLLAERGPRHGHQLRRDAELAEVDRWAGVGVGSLHRELRGLEAESLIEAGRTERGRGGRARGGGPEARAAHLLPDRRGAPGAIGATPAGSQPA